jgi:hypothetical protein
MISLNIVLLSVTNNQTSVRPEKQNKIAPVWFSSQAQGELGKHPSSFGGNLSMQARKLYLDNHSKRVDKAAGSGSVQGPGKRPSASG